MYTTQGGRGGSKTWSAYITKSDVVVQQETMSRNVKNTAKLLKYKEYRQFQRLQGKRNRYLGTGYTLY